MHVENILSVTGKLLKFRTSSNPGILRLTVFRSHGKHCSKHNNEREVLFLLLQVNIREVDSVFHKLKSRQKEVPI